MADSASGLQRFIDAQDVPHTGLATALAELRAGRKRSHWIWYVFPQLRGLGRSPLAEHYGLAGVAEAEAYANDTRLRARLLAAASAALDQLRAGVPLDVLMGSEIDVLKLVSSMTLFGALARRLAGAGGNPELRQLADAADALVAAAERDGYRRCAYTERQLARDDAGADG